jgi:hypothetical protein
MSLGTRSKSRPRRVVHPFPLPTPGQVVTSEDVREGVVAFGVQAELCRNTLCVACFAMWWRRVHGPTTIDWTQQPAIVGGKRSQAHHEPARGTDVSSADPDCISLCEFHHVGGFVSRHAARWSANDGADFYAHFNIKWRAARDEMRRRVALLTKPVLATASETTR